MHTLSCNTYKEDTGDRAKGATTVGRNTGDVKPTRIRARMHGGLAEVHACNLYPARASERASEVSLKSPSVAGSSFRSEPQ